MQLLIEENEKRHYDSVWSGKPGRLPVFQAGETQPLSVGVMRRMRQQFDSRIFSPIDLEDWTIQAAIGGGFILPVAGSLSLGWGGDEVGNIPFAPTATEISDALNGLEAITAAGGVTVQGANGYFVVTFNDVGARATITADASMLVPLSVVDIQEAVAGDGDTSEVQTIRITQNVGTLATLSTDSAAPSADVDLFQQGDATHNHKVRVTLPENRYGGTWTYTSASVESGPIGYDDSAEQIERVLEAISSVGTGNVSVAQETESTFLVTYIGTKALQAIAGISIDGSTLLTITTKSGTLDLRVAGIEMLLNGATAKVVSLEIEGTPAGGTPQKLLQHDVLLTRPVIERANVPPVVTSTLVQDAPFSLLTGGTSSALDGVVTVNLVTYRWLAKVVRDIDGTYSESEWFLIPGTTAENAADGVVRPDDYHASTNAKIWVRVSGE